MAEAFHVQDPVIQHSVTPDRPSLKNRLKNMFGKTININLILASFQARVRLRISPGLILSMYLYPYWASGVISSLRTLLQNSKGSVAEKQKSQK